MSKIKAPRKSAQRIVIFFSFFLLLSIPLVIMGLSQDSLDIRNRAYEDITVSEENPCVISFPYVNPYSLEAGKTFTVQVEAETTLADITTLKITDSSGNSIYTENFETLGSRIYTSFKYTPEKSGQIDLLGLIETDTGGSFACKISSPYDILGLRVVNNNSKPTFTTQPSASQPSQAIVTNDSYEYTLVASDTDSDNINYSYSFTPQADWLKPLVIEDGSNGKLTIKFSGSTNKPASYLANVIIHDGYSKHISTQSWVISVSPKENDNPIIKILSPLTSLRINKGDTFKAKWDATDLNQIAKYQLYIASNPTDEASWTTIDDNISYKTTEYTVPTTSLSPGVYKLIARAIDNQDPQAIGMDISDEIVISGTGTDSTGSDDQAILDQPQVTNMSPSSTEEVTNPRVTIKATILAGLDATLVEDEGNISFKVDDIDKTADLKINKLSDNAYTLIFQPQEDLTAGLHKVEIYVKDSLGNETTKSWTFNLTAEEESTSGIISLFGYDISQRTLIIIGAGLLLLILAIVGPIIIIKVWKDDKDTPQASSKLPPTTPEDNTQYQPVASTTDLKEKVDTTPIEEPRKDVWDNYQALKPEPKVTQEKKEEISSSTEPVPVPDENKQLTDLAILEEKPVEKTEEPTPIPQPVVPEPEEIEEPIVEPPIPTPEPVPVVEEEPVQTPPQPITPEIPEPVIPEPEIPSFETPQGDEEVLKQLYSQIQKVQEEDKQNTGTNS